ncbi:hypothetical protein C5I_0100040 [Pseudomonas syringae pv. syringae FF5]|nr:hypothetical protein C5I_0100040 [Pseudomonas syringae pv. syringae FF5]
MSFVGGDHTNTLRVQNDRCDREFQGLIEWITLIWAVARWPIRSESQTVSPGPDRKMIQRRTDWIDEGKPLKFLSNE